MEFTPAPLPFFKNKNLDFLVLNRTNGEQNNEIKKLQRIMGRGARSPSLPLALM